MQILIDTDKDALDEVLDHLNAPFMVAAIESFGMRLRMMDKADLTDDAAALMDEVRKMYYDEFGEYLK